MHLPRTNALQAVLRPLGQLLLFVLGGSVIISLIVILAAYLLRGTRDDMDLVQITFVLLPQVLVDGITLGFVYATLSVRRLFQGEYIALWKGFGQLETWSYSALWLSMGVAVLAIGVRLNSTVLRIASAGLVIIAVAKVFLFDMSELEGVLRALSFIGLGAVLIGIGLFYQRMLTRTPREAAAR